MTIRKKFIVFSMLWGMVPVIALTSIYIGNFRAKSMELIKQNVATSASDQAIYLQTFFEEKIRNINTDSKSQIIEELLTDSNNEMDINNESEKIKSVNEILNLEKEEESFISSELLFNKQGIVISSSGNININEKVLLSEEQIRRLENNNVVVTDIIESKNLNNGVKSAIIARPIFINDQYEGSIACVINMNYFKSLVNRIHPYKTTKTAIMDEKGIIGASSSSDLGESIESINMHNNLYEQWNNIDFDANPNGIIEYNINGVEKVGYYSRIENTRWIVFSSIELSELNEPINKTIADIIVFIVLFLLILMSSYLFVINYFSKPVYELLDVIRKLKEGNYKNRFIYNKNNEFGEIATAFNKLASTIEKNKKHMENKNRLLESLTSNIPGGVHRNIVIDGEYFIDFLSGGCLKLMGYKKNEFKKVFGKKIVDLIYEKDRERVKREVEEQIEKYNEFTVEYRIKRKDGSIIWILDNGKIIKDKNGKTFSYNVIIDITNSKMALEELRLSEERYRIVTSQTDDIIFEWNVKEDTIFYSGNLKNKYDLKASFREITKKIHESDYIYKDDIDVFSKMLNDIIKGEPYREVEIRMRKIEGIHIWCKIRITAIFDENGDIFKAIGLITDIDKEKKEAEELLFKAQRDSLTELYNKGTTESMIEEYIENEGAEKNGAMFLIDLDNFKSINDTLGHLAGDFVLTNISSMLSKVFEENSIVGRIGGDEFIVFFKDVDSEEVIHNKAEELVNGFRKNFIEEFENYKISGSIGIAKYPEHGKCFEELYINADKAAYLAKHNGKDNYCLFKEI